MLDDDPTLQEVLDLYLKTQPLTDRTKYIYGYQITQHCRALLPLKISQITAPHIAKFKRETKRAGSNHTTALSVLELILRFAARARIVMTTVPVKDPEPDQLTLSYVFEDYINAGKLKPATVRNYRQRFTCYLPDWMHLPVNSITKKMVEQRHIELSKIGASTADSTFRNLRALLTYASIKYEDAEGLPIIRANPCRRLTELKMWHADKRRISVVEVRQIGLWFRAVWSLESRIARDMLLILLFTGLRHGEVKGLEWRQVDLKIGTLTIPEEKSKNKKKLVIPLSDFVWRLLSDRRLSYLADARWDQASPFVFPGQYSKRGESHISNIDKSIRTVKERTGIAFMIHDLRRSFITIGDELDLNPGLVKALVNHGSRDVTEGYTIRSLEKLRRTTQKITNFMLSLAARDMGFDAKQAHSEQAMRRILALPFHVQEAGT